MNYSVFQAASGPAGGIGGLQPGNWQPGVINYILVNSVDEHVEKIKKAGGKIGAPKNEVPGRGWFAIFEEPSGTRLALWQQNPNAPHMHPLGDQATPSVDFSPGASRNVTRHGPHPA